KLSHQLGGFLPCERFDRGQRVFIWRNCVPHTYNGPETVFWTAACRNPQNSSIVVIVPRCGAVFDSKSPQKSAMDPKSPQCSSRGGHQESRFQPPSKQKTPVMQESSM